MPYKSKKLKAIDTSSLDKLGDSVVDLSKWVEDEFAQLATDLQSTEPDTIWQKAPPKPRRGTYVYADGTNWNPGNGEGPYWYDGTTYHPMGQNAVAGAITDAPSDGFTYGRQNAVWTRIAQITASAITWALQCVFPLTTLVDGANISWNVATAQKAKVTLGGNRTMNAVTNAVEGTTYYLWVIQDGTGTRTLAWTTTGAGSFDFGAAGAPTLTTAINKADLLCFEAISIAGTLKLRYTGIAKGFS